MLALPRVVPDLDLDKWTKGGALSCSTDIDREEPPGWEFERPTWYQRVSSSGVGLPKNPPTSAPLKGSPVTPRVISMGRDTCGDSRAGGGQCSALGDNIRRRGESRDQQPPSWLQTLKPGPTFPVIPSISNCLSDYLQITRAWAKHLETAEAPHLTCLEM